MEKQGKRPIKTHLAIFKQPYLNLILDGKKTIESRFSMDRRAPYQQISIGDRVIVKESGGLVHGEFTVGKVEFLELQKESRGMEYCRSFSKEIGSDVDGNFWQSRKNKKFVSLIGAKDPQKYDSPRTCTEKPNRSMAGWFVLK